MLFRSKIKPQGPSILLIIPSRPEAFNALLATLFFTTKRRASVVLSDCLNVLKSGLATPEYFTTKSAFDFFNVSLIRFSETSLNINPSFFIPELSYFLFFCTPSLVQDDLNKIKVVNYMASFNPGFIEAQIERLRTNLPFTDAGFASFIASITREALL